MTRVLVLNLSYSFGLGCRSFQCIGLYKTPPRRILGSPVRKFKNRLYARKHCEKIAKYGRYQAFALRYGRYCYVGRFPNRKFTRYGRSRSRRPGALKVFLWTSGSVLNLALYLTSFQIIGGLLTIKPTVSIR